MSVTINDDGSITGTFASLEALYQFYVAQVTGTFVKPNPTVPGYMAGPITYVQVPNARAGGTDGFSSYPNIESVLQLRVQALANTFTTQGLGDDKVRELLTESASDAKADNGSYDPLIPQADALIEKYVKVFRVAVTPV